MMADAIGALVELGGDDDGKLEVARLEALPLLQLHQQLTQVLERRRHMRQHRGLIAERTIAVDKRTVGGSVGGWQIAWGQQRHAGHDGRSSSSMAGDARHKSTPP